MDIDYLEAAKNQILAIEGEHHVEEVNARMLTAIADVLVHNAMKDELTCEMTEIFCGTASGIEFVCSECGSTCFVSEPLDTDEKPRYCPNCGAKVVEE